MTQSANLHNPSSTGRSLGPRIVVAIAVGLVLIPWIWQAAPGEIAAWYAAAALEKELDDDAASALPLMDAAIRWNPDPAEYYLHRARIRLAVKKFEQAVEDCDRAVERQPELELESLQLRLLAYQRAGEHDLALTDADTIVELAAQGPPPTRFGSGFWIAYDDALNLRAYARALANQEIKEGLEDIETALSMQQTDNAAYLDTRGYLRYLDGDLLGALVDMEKAVKLSEARGQQIDQLPPDVDPRIRQQREQLQREELAVLYHHRGLVYEGLVLNSEAAADFRRAQQFGYSPDDGVW